MPESLLTIFNWLFLALLFLFLFRVLHVVVMELRHPAVPVVPPRIAPPPVKAPTPTGKEPRREARGPALRIVEPVARAGERFPVSDDISVGRAGGCGIVLTEDTFVSQVHARVFRRGRQIYVEDLESRNGTFVDGVRITEPVQLKKGAHVQFGSTIVEVV